MQEDIHKSKQRKSKQEWRTYMSTLKSRLREEEWREQSGGIRNQLFACPDWQQSTHIALYYSKDKEVDTLAIIEQGWREGKEIYLPKCHPQEKQLTFYRVTSFDQLEVVYYGLHEPIPSQTEPLQIENLEVVIVPGLVFDHEGYRIGYGAGFYDRFLSTLPERVRTVSLAFHFQVLGEENVPKNSFDIPVDLILTEAEIIHCQKNVEKRK